MENCKEVHAKDLTAGDWVYPTNPANGCKTILEFVKTGEDDLWFNPIKNESGYYVSDNGLIGFNRRTEREIVWYLILDKSPDRSLDNSSLEERLATAEAEIKNLTDDNIRLNDRIKNHYSVKLQTAYDLIYRIPVNAPIPVELQKELENFISLQS